MTEVSDVPEPYKSAHAASFRSKAQLLASKWAGCFYCGVVFKPALIKKWIDNEETAMCPVCGIDSVLPITTEWFESDFLEQMHRYWFAASYLRRRPRRGLMPNKQSRLEMECRHSDYGEDAGGYRVLRFDGEWVGRVTDYKLGEKLIEYVAALETENAALRAKVNE